LEYGGEEDSGKKIWRVSSSNCLHVTPKVFLNIGPIQTVAMGFSGGGQPKDISQFFNGGPDSQWSFDVYLFFGEEAGPELSISSKSQPVAGAAEVPAQGGDKSHSTKSSW
jgi:hypothetical protein